MNTVVNIKLNVPQTNLALEVLRAARDDSDSIARGRSSVKASPTERRLQQRRALQLTEIIEVIES